MTSHPQGATFIELFQGNMNFWHMATVLLILKRKPMWYSWKGHDHPPSHRPGNHASNTHYLPTILNQKHTSYDDGSFSPLSPSVHLAVLWPVFLKNVHPLVKIFFDWEIAPVVEKAQRNATGLTVEEEALVSGIRFIAAFTLSHEECQSSLSESKHEFLQHCQRSVEYALTKAEYTETTDKRVLQAFMLYISTMRDRTRPSAIHPLMGIASRVAERMGLHRDGSTFGLSALRSEERRRIWWQLQFLELAVSRLVGALSLTIFATWDTQMPSNLEDSDFNPTTEIMPVERKGLTSISPCLWRYSILQRRRELLGKDSSGDLAWMLSPHMSLAIKDTKIDELETILAERFLQHCELVNPLHVHMQIGIRLFGLSARSNVRQPTLVNAKISELLPAAREDLLGICSKSLEYYILSQTTPSISGFRWGNDIFFQVPSFVYVILEAHQRSGQPQVADLWNLIGRVYGVHPDLMTATTRPEVEFLARITAAAWQRYELEMRQQRPDADAIETPEWIRQLFQSFNLPVIDSSATVEEATQSLYGDLLPENFDFDIIDWSAWEALRFIYVAPWVHTGANSGTVTPSRLQSQMRTLSPPANKTVTKSVSSPQLKKFVRPMLDRSDSEALNTIPDPRAATPRPEITRNNSTDSNTMHPDLSQEVATLSTKLIDAINHQTKLDDSLQQTRHELETARTRLAQLELQVKVHEQKVAQGLLVEKEVYEKMEKQMSSELSEERRRRRDAEKAKKKTDNEVETLTTALFEEANGMVSAARKETEASEKRNDQLRQQLIDAEILQTNMQEQLQDLKGVLEKMSAHGDDESNTLATTTAPSTPGITPADKMSKMFETNGQTPNTPGSDEISPNHPLHFTHLVLPVLRSDLTSIKEFQDMLKVSSRSAPNSRVSSGNYGSLNVLGLGSLTNSSTSSLPLAKSPNSISTNSPRESLTGSANLKDERFYKRSLSEDIEPTLRLDIAPGLSWMARRTVLNSITSGSLVVEPAPPPPKFRAAIFPCSLCGEVRKGDEYARKFRFKSSETDDTRHPLCDWCLGRVRSTCDYISFLRMVAAGHWRAESEDEKKAAWEESVRLRERMFWSRIGGGVIPAFIASRDSPRSPIFANGTDSQDATRKSEESQLSEKPLDSAVDMMEPTGGARKSEDDPFLQSKGEEKLKRVSIGKTIISTEPAPAESLTKDEEKKIEEEAEAQLHAEVRKSMDARAAESEPQQQRPYSMPPSPEPSSKKKDERLSLTIPGSFE
ncbi:hypothetical protein P171DRAFT_488975 [Karstenula rhodostoma CBS 690.94]|uniref:Xylanolytic transcriptional activator regulatory domain-containing protein n=1 Tax=Karstenula rhodostoma CBS 690.94 TaxID=1392251 RepID=A0A9P4P890_9PLEO|nr:hypothetical protein P171DRAFT_488975 [Karstenula rhodostoma CBS 690.94]